MTQNIIDLAVNQIKKDVKEGNIEALKVLIESIPQEILIAYIPFD